MKIEITSYTLENHILTINAIDLESYDLHVIERGEPDIPGQFEVSFVFDTTHAKEFDYVNRWLHNQKCVRESNPKTYGEALYYTIGHISNMNQYYLYKN